MGRAVADLKDAHGCPTTPPTKVLIAGVGHDRPGIVAAVTGVLAKLDCNIEDTSMTQLGSAAHRAFTWILIAALGPSAQVETLQQALTVAGQPLGLTFFVSPYQDDATDPELADEPSPYLVTVAGLESHGYYPSGGPRLGDPRGQHYRPACQADSGRWRVGVHAAD